MSSWSTSTNLSLMQPQSVASILRLFKPLHMRKANQPPEKRALSIAGHWLRTESGPQLATKLRNLASEPVMIVRQPVDPLIDAIRKSPEQTAQGHTHAQDADQFRAHD